MEQGCLARVVRAFAGAAKGELDLAVGSVVQVIRKVDRYWTYGCCDGNYGSFPTGVVSEMALPPFEPGQQLFVAKEGFAAQEPDDLGFRRGDIIAGLNAVDSNWWRGRIASQTGIFPMNLVWKVDMSLLQVLQQTRKGCGPGMAHFRAMVNMDLKAQLDEEIDLLKGDIVTVTEIIDKDWYRGECNGHRGMFPSAFVTKLDGIPTSTLPDLLSFEEINGKLTLTVNEFDEPSLPPPCVPPPPPPTAADPYRSLRDVVIPEPPKPVVPPAPVDEPHCKTVYPFLGEFANELSFSAGEVVRLLRRVGPQWLEGELNGRVGLFPLCYVQVVVDLPDDKPTKGQQLTRAEEDGGDPEEEAVALYDFSPQVDVGVCEGERVAVLAKLDDSWYQVRNLAGDCGLCPAAYLQLLDGVGDGSAERLQRHMSLPVFSRTSKDHKWQKAVTNNAAGHSARTLDDPESWSVGSSTVGQPNRSTNGVAQSFLTPNATGVPESRVKYSAPFYLKDSGRRSSLPSSSAPVRKTPPPPRPPPVQLEQQSPWPQIKATAQDRITRIPLRAAPPLPTNVRRPSSAQTTPTASPSSVARIQHLRRSGGRTVAMSDAGTWSSTLNEPIQGVSEIEVTAQDVDDEIDPCQIRKKDCRPRSESRTSLQEARERNRDKRRRIIEELLQTERAFVSDMQLCRDAFLQNPEEGKAKSINVEFLIGHVDPVLRVNRRLLTSLENGARMPMDDQKIGICFQQVAADIKKVYGDYCANHDDVINLLEKYEENPETAAYIQEKLARGTNPNFFSLSSVLIKPVQRVLKYPLLLNELVKVTEDDSPDKSDLAAALKAMTAVADEINECRRRKDLVVKYRKETDGGLTAKISKLSIHSMVKKSQRIGMRLSSHLGLASVTKDVAFDEVEQKFRDTERTVRQLLKDTEVFCVNLEECVTAKFNLAEHIANFYEEQRTRKDVDSFRTIQRNVRTSIWPEFKTTVEARLTKPLTSLLHFYDGPNKLIEKRNDKLLDYDSASQRLEKNKDVNRGKQLRDELEAAKKNYSALNAQLLEELPKLVQLSVEILVECVGAFLAARRRFMGHTTKFLFELTEQIPALAPSEDILTSFCETHADIVNWMTSTGIIHKEFQPSPRLERTSKDKEKAPASNRGQSTNVNIGSQPKSQIQVSQSSSRKAYLQGRYARELLFCATHPHAPTNEMELALSAGDLVAVIKQKDPMGGTGRWFVDTGAQKGFVPSKILTPLTLNLATPSLPATRPPVSPQSSRKADEAWTPSEPPPQYRNYYDTVPPEDEPQFRYDNAPFQGFELPESNGARYDLPCDFDPIASDGTSETALEGRPGPDQTGQAWQVTDAGPHDLPASRTVSPLIASVPSILINQTEDGTKASVENDNPYFFATFAFTATGPNELSLSQGQVVLVRHKQDLQGNPEWWYVEDRYGNQGYAPASYLLHYPAGAE